MRWATFRVSGSASDRVGVVDSDEVRALAPGVELLGLLGDDGERLATAGDDALKRPADVFALGAVQLRAPVPKPPSVRDFYAFEDHVRTARAARGLPMEPAWYELPVFYFTNPHAVIATGDALEMPPGTEELDFELEVAAVVGRGGRDLDPATAADHLAGLMVMNDWSARDVQRREMTVGLGPAKGKDFATTLGPWLVTLDELEDRRADGSYDLTMTASVNGREYSRGCLADMHWSFGELLAYASRGTRVEPGDVIGTGTCGTGCILELSLVHGSERFPWLQPGDEVTLEVEGLGAVTNVTRSVDSRASRSP